MEYALISERIGFNRLAGQFAEGLVQHDPLTCCGRLDAPRHDAGGLRSLATAQVQPGF
jgi:hypothetical protein